MKLKRIKLVVYGKPLSENFLDRVLIGMCQMEKVLYNNSQRGGNKRYKAGWNEEKVIWINKNLDKQR